MRELQIVDAAGLAAAYAGASYCVLLDGETLPLRVGQPATDLEAYWPAQCYLFITAWNPASLPRCDVANATSDARLVARLDAAGAARQPAWAEGLNSDWREPGWLLANLERDYGLALAQEFGQAGVLMWERSQPVRLRMMVARPANAASLDFIDWAS